jgi:hypothetical protein
MANELGKLKLEMELFDRWAATLDRAHLSAEWECAYEEWPRVYTAFSSFIAATSYEVWGEEAIQIILYLVARDNECEVLIRELAGSPDRLLVVAVRAIAHTDRDARWQVASVLGDLTERRLDAELILLQFAGDGDEYVRRRAILALGRLGSSLVARLAEEAWNREDPMQEYQRMAVLTALHDSSSASLEDYVRRAEADGRSYLLSTVREIRDAEGRCDRAPGPN